MSMVRSWKGILGFSAVFLAAAFLLAQGADAGKSKAKAVAWAAEDLKWTDAPGAPPGVQQATLWGDSSKGAFGAMQKFPAGFSAPMHTHSSELHMVVVSGTVIHGPEGAPEKRLGPGSYLLLTPTYKHTTACDKASECVFFIEGKGKFDVNLVEEKK
jgi:quercetin dioxygenase-like cupin family protein